MVAMTNLAWGSMSSCSYHGSFLMIHTADHIFSSKYSDPLLPTSTMLAFSDINFLQVSPGAGLYSALIGLISWGALIHMSSPIFMWLIGWASTKSSSRRGGCCTGATAKKLWRRATNRATEVPLRLHGVSGTMVMWSVPWRDTLRSVSRVCGLMTPKCGKNSPQELQKCNGALYLVKVLWVFPLLWMCTIIYSSSRVSLIAPSSRCHWQRTSCIYISL